MDESSEVKPVVTEADVASIPVAGEQGNAPAVAESPAVVPVVAESSASPSIASATSQPATDEKAGMRMRLHAAIDALEAKIGGGVHVFAHEVAAVRELVKAIV